jgi:hypothetical protein
MDMVIATKNHTRNVAITDVKHAVWNRKCQMNKNEAGELSKIRSVPGKSSMAGIFSVGN